MASWGNTENQWHNQDMDSNGQKLTVRNSGATVGTDFRAEIADTGTDAKALRVNGQTEFKRGTTVVGHISPQSSVGTPVLAINANLDSTTNDGDVLIGWKGPQPDTGNRLVVDAKQIVMGSTAGDEHVAMDGVVKLYGTLEVADTLKAATNIQANTLDSLNSGDTILIGGTSANAVRLGRSAHQTKVMGGLVVDGTSAATTGLYVGQGGANISGNVDIRNGSYVAIGNANLNQVTNINASGTIGAAAVNLTGAATATALDINGSGDVSGALTVHGDLSGGNLITSGSLVADTGIVCGEALNVDTTKIEVGVPSTVKANSADSAILTVNQSSSSSTTPALDVLVNSQNLGGLGLQVTAAKAIKAFGHCELGGTVEISGATTHSDSVSLNGHDLAMGGSGAGAVTMRYANNRLDILVGGVTRFYIDSTGGHNA